MFATLVTVTLFAAAAINGAVADLSVSTPTGVTTCSPVQITWTDTENQGPYNLIMVPADDACADPLFDSGDQSGTSLTYTPAVAPGTAMQMSLLNSAGVEAWSGTFTVEKGSNLDCVPADLLAAASSSAASSSLASTSASATVAGTTLVVTGTTSTKSSASASASVGPAGALGNNSPLKNNNTNGATREATSLFMILGAIAGVLAFSL